MRISSAIFCGLLAASFPANILLAQTKFPEKVLSGFSHPESVLQDGHYLYVSNIGAELEPAKKDGDGFISRVDLSTGKVLDLHFLPATGTLNAPKGMARIGSTLYTTDLDRIAGFNTSNRSTVFELTIPGTGFLNDLVAGEDKLYVSATDNGKIYEIDPATSQYRALPLSDTIAGANGLYYDHHTLYCVTLGTWGKWDGRLLAIDLKTMQVKELSDYRGMLDGVDQHGGLLYFSDWKGMDRKGNIFTLNLKTGKVSELKLPSGEIAGPADFSISKDHQYLIIPALLEGKIYLEPM
jgi:outer membrane protein assembly factor BamB